jgi:hypothetical protein
MSKFGQQQTVFTDGELLCSALRDMGFQPQQHEQPVHLFGYHGDQRKEVAEIVIPRAQIGGSSNDVGFVKRGDSYSAIISEFDSSRFNSKWMGQLAVNYKEKFSVKKMTGLGYKFLGREIVQTSKGATVQMRFES